ncbi:esterase/lipase family protein [Actomonas aquatica]|uniref:Alpha/beta fold hydrolase n=1 Tax=Actomonas aquatica TaxID=2866162 RepID=A0ABZ1C4J2_9BACT|nr:alpha/beta fold hydrolase [Opitutus sp. WL0086]WRQ86238.1 alpha/beta fold hydrolase [Opitutus sp. WL0086]
MTRFAPGLAALLCLCTVNVPAASVSSAPPTSTAAVASPAGETVVLLHGLGLGAWAMKRTACALQREGYHVINLSYDSLRTPLSELCETWLPTQLEAHGVDLSDGAPPVHFVTHSMGGIMLRGWLKTHGVPEPLTRGRVVMYAPPNQGSSLVDRIGRWKLFQLSTGVNGRRLSTAPDSFPNQLGAWPEGPQLGILAGNRPINPLLAYWCGGPGDGKVRVAETKLEGMADHLVLPHSHTWIQYRKPAITQVVTFLRDGAFAR